MVFALFVYSIPVPTQFCKILSFLGQSYQNLPLSRYLPIQSFSGMNFECSLPVQSKHKCPKAKSPKHLLLPAAQSRGSSVDCSAAGQPPPAGVCLCHWPIVGLGFGPATRHWPLFRHPPQIYWTATHPKPKACGPVSPGSSLIDENIFILCFLPVLPPPSHIPIFPDRFPHFPCRFAPTLFLYQSPIRGSKCKNKKFKICKMAPKFALPIGDRTMSLLSQKRGHLRKQCSRYHPRI